MVPEAIKSKGTLTVGSDTTYAPAEFLGTDGQTPVGYDVDIAKAIGATLGLKVQVQTAEFTGILPALGPKYDLGHLLLHDQPGAARRGEHGQLLQRRHRLGRPEGQPEEVLPG